MFLGKLQRHLTKQNWFAVVIDLLIVIAGILIAFQINSCSEKIQEHRLERQYLQRLSEDLENEILRMDEALEFAELRIRAVKFLDQVRLTNTIAADSARWLPWAVETASWRSFPQINAFVYNELQNTGNLALIRSDALRLNLDKHYTTIQHYAHVGMDLEAQHWFDYYTAGILTIEELVALEREEWDNKPLVVSNDRAGEIAAEFLSRKEAIALLPSLAQHHAFNTKVIEDARRRTEQLIAQIDTLMNR